MPVHDAYCAGMINFTRRLPIAARLVSTAMLASSLFGFAGTASAQSFCVSPCFTVNGPDLIVSVSTTPVQHSASHTYVLRVTNTSGSSYRGYFRAGPSAANVRVNLLGSIVDPNRTQEELSSSR